MSPRLDSITISDFRSIRGKITVPLDAPVVLIHGPNGVGKTSVLSAIELALTGHIPSLGRVEPDYLNHLVHKQAQQGVIELSASGFPNSPKPAQLVVKNGMVAGMPMLDKRHARFFSERCYLPQSALGRLLELYQHKDTRKSDSPLTEFVKDLLGLNQLDALIEGLHDAGDVRRLKDPVPAYQETRDLIDRIERTIKTDSVELDGIEGEVRVAEVRLIDRLNAFAPDLAKQALNISFLRPQLQAAPEEQRLSFLARLKRDIDAANSEWATISAAPDAEVRRQLEADRVSADNTVQRWQADTGQKLDKLLDELSTMFSNLPRSSATQPEFTRSTALRAVEKELERCTLLVAQNEADLKRLAELDQALAGATARSATLDQQISGLAVEASSLAQALATIVPHVHSDDCPVCGRNFGEISKRPLSAHLSGRIATLTENAGRLQALSKEKNTTIALIAQLGRERAQVEGRKISDQTLIELKTRRARMEEFKIQMEGLAPSTLSGVNILTRAATIAKQLDEFSGRDRRAVELRKNLGAMADDLPAAAYDSKDAIEVAISKLRAALAREEQQLGVRQEQRRAAMEELLRLASQSARRDQLHRELAEDQSRLKLLIDAKAKADERVSSARELARAARDVRTGVVRRVFNDSLNLIWRDLFVRLAPEEPFVPAFALPEKSDGPVEAILETHYREGGKGGNPRAMLGAGMKRRDFLGVFGSAVAAFPLVAHAQQPERERRIGILIPLAESDSQAQTEVMAFRERLQQLGWTEGRNARIDRRWAAGDVGRIQAYAKELVALQPDVILARTTPVTAAVLQETRTIPIVFVGASDPVGAGFATSVARPGGNATGFTNVEATMGGKWVEVLKEINPGITKIAVMFNPKTSPGGGSYYLRLIQDAARSIAVEIITTPVEDAAEIERTIEAFAREPNAGLLVQPDVTTHSNRTLIISLAAKHRLPAVHAKFLLWNSDDAVVSSMNWGSQSGSPDDPLDEIGLHLEGAGLATCLLAKFEDQLDD